MSEIDTSFTCKNCLYFKKDHEEEIIDCGDVIATVIRGECRRNPPSIGNQLFPKITGDEWCGEFKGITQLKNLLL